MPVNVQGVRIPLGPLTGILILKCPGTLKAIRPLAGISWCLATLEKRVMFADADCSRPA